MPKFAAFDHWHGMQGADNFKKEFKQLRRSFRFNDYKEIREQNPPTNPFARVSI